MKRVSLLVVLLVALAVGLRYFSAGPRNGSDTILTAAEEAAIVAEIDSLTAEWWDAWQEMDFTNARTVVLSPEIVWTLREGDSRIFDTAGTLVSEGQFIETAVWVRQSGEWKVLLGHDNDVTPVEPG